MPDRSLPRFLRAHQGVPSYNDVREAYGFPKVEAFDEITPDETVQELLSLAYGADVDLLDAYVGAVAEKEEGSTLFAGPLSRVRGNRCSIFNDVIRQRK